MPLSSEDLQMTIETTFLPQDTTSSRFWVWVLPLAAAGAGLPPFMLPIVLFIAAVVLVMLLNVPLMAAAMTFMLAIVTLSGSCALHLRRAVARR